MPANYAKEVRCPQCRAYTGNACRSLVTGRVMRQVHPERTKRLLAALNIANHQDEQELLCEWLRANAGIWDEKWFVVDYRGDEDDE